MLETPRIYPWRKKFCFILFCWPDTHFSNAESNIVIYQSIKIHKCMLGKSHSFENLVKQEIMKVGWEECLWYPQQSSWNNRDYSLPRISAEKWALVLLPERWWRAPGCTYLNNAFQSWSVLPSPCTLTCYWLLCVELEKLCLQSKAEEC